MRGLASTIIGMTVLGIFTGWLDRAEAQNRPAPSRVDRLLAQVVEGHNKERAKQGLGPLSVETHLTEAAQVHARDMAEHQEMTHDGSDGSTGAERVSRTGYHYLLTGENVAHGYRTSAEVMRGWMDSPPHKKNILADFSEIGVAVAYAEDGRPFWCVEFGKPMPKFEPITATSELVKKINEERKLAKKLTLIIEPKLAASAQEKAALLAKEEKPGGGTATLDGIDQKAFKDLAVSTAAGQPDADAMIKVILADPGLKEQILGKYTRIGTGYATSETGTPYWCVILANPARK